MSKYPLLIDSPEEAEALQDAYVKRFVEDSERERDSPLFPREPPTQQEVERAVFVMNDCTGGQFGQLMEIDGSSSIEEWRYLFHWATQAKLAVTYGRNQLTPYALEIIEQLSTRSRNIENALTIRLGKHYAKEIYRSKVKTAPRSNLDRSGFVYLIQSPTGAYKIGRTRDPKNRMKTFGIQLPFEVEYVCVIPAADMYTTESDLHALYAEKRINGEWFLLDLADIEHIKGLAT